MIERDLADGILTLRLAHVVRGAFTGGGAQAAVGGAE